MTEGATVKPVVTGHVGINVTNLERSKQFYMKTIGLELMNESTGEGKRYAFLGDGQRLVLTLWQQSEGRFNARSPGLHHLSFELSSLSEVEEAVRRLEGMGVRILHDGIVAHREGVKSGGIYFEDPDGTRLEIYAPDAGKDHAAPAGQAPTCGFF
ncbi:MAG: VOC family protein [Planctomycetota bacterium]|jgi:catechol-2,3-dioxygenase